MTGQDQASPILSQPTPCLYWGRKPGPWTPPIRSRHQNRCSLGNTRHWKPHSLPMPLLHARKWIPCLPGVSTVAMPWKTPLLWQPLSRSTHLARNCSTACKAPGCIPSLSHQASGTYATYAVQIEKVISHFWGFHRMLDTVDKMKATRMKKELKLKFLIVLCLLCFLPLRQTSQHCLLCEMNAIQTLCLSSGVDWKNHFE